VATTLEVWSRKEVCSVIHFYGQNVFHPIEIRSQLVEVYDDGIMKVQHVRE
jgi:ribosomal protein S24E